MTEVFIGADHAGFKVKESVKTLLAKKGIVVHDCGAFSLDKDDDYPLYALSVAKRVISKNNSKGILFCKSGVGMAIAANKMPGIRAVATEDAKIAKHSRIDNNSNVLCISSEKPMGTIKKIINIWLETEFSGEERHKRRIMQIAAFER